MRCIPNYPPSRLLVEPFRIAGFGDRDRRVDENFDELARAHESARRVALAAEWRDASHKSNQSGIDHQACDFGHPADVFDAVGIGETEILVQSEPDVVAVEQIGVFAECVQPGVDDVGDGRLTRLR